MSHSPIMTNIAYLVGIVKMRERGKFDIYSERTRFIILSFISSSVIFSFSGKKVFGLTLRAEAILNKVSTEGCFFPFSRLARKLRDRFDLTDNSS